MVIKKSTLVTFKVCVWGGGGGGVALVVSLFYGKGVELLVEGIISQYCKILKFSRGLYFCETSQ